MLVVVITVLIVRSRRLLFFFQTLFIGECQRVRLFTFLLWQKVELSVIGEFMLLTRFYGVVDVVVTNW